MAPEFVKSGSVTLTLVVEMNRGVPTVMADAAALVAGFVEQVAVVGVVVDWNCTNVVVDVNFGVAVASRLSVMALPPVVGPVSALRVIDCWVTVVTACDAVAAPPTAAAASARVTP